MEEVDYIIVGAGSAGSVLANRLSEDGRFAVCVLEYGGSDAGPLIQMPSALSIPMNMARYDWGYRSEVEPGLAGRRLATPRGKVIGGSSSINGMVYVRGHGRDFDTWEEMGAKGWNFAGVLGYFKRLETSHGGQEGWRGQDGPMHVTRGRQSNPLYAAFIEAGRQAGYPVTEDYNGEQQEGFGAMEMTVWQGRRWSAANAYLRPALGRDNLRLLTRAFVRRVLFQGRRASGVEYSRHGRVRTLRARREVIVAASAINSPKLLQLSGIGPRRELEAAGIDVIADRPGVGANLMDHLEVYFQVRARQPITLNGKLGMFSKARIGLEWMLFKSGLGATNHFEACGFIRSRAGVEYPDIQFHFLPCAVRYDGKLAIEGHGFQAHVGPQRMKSRGHVRIRSGDPMAPPEIRFNYLSHGDDMADFITSVRLTREIFGQRAFDPFRGDEIQPGEGVTSDDDIADFIRRHAESAYHPCGTCAMGDGDHPDTVVDPECRVVGVEALRVVDSSIFPLIPNGNLNAPSLMVGERGADLILGRELLPAANQQPWIHPHWRSSQR